MTIIKRRPLTLAVLGVATALMFGGCGGGTHPTSASSESFRIALVTGDQPSPCAGAALPYAFTHRCLLLGGTVISRVDISAARARDETVSGSEQVSVILDLTPSASTRFDTFSVEHAGSAVAVVVGRRVVSAPPLQGGPFHGSIAVTVLNREDADATVTAAKAR